MQQRERRESGAEQDGRELTGVARSQHLLYVLPHDPAAIPQFMDPVIERTDGDRDATQVLVLTADSDMAVAVAAALTRTEAGLLLRAVPVTSASRATRLMTPAPPVVAGSPEELLELLRASTLKLEHVSTIVVAWADALLTTAEETTVEALLSELPRDATRVVVASELTPKVEDFVERHARRARRVGDVSVERATALDLRYLTSSADARARSLRRLLDLTNPEQVAIYVRSDDLEGDVRRLVRALGYVEDSGMEVTRGDAVRRKGATLILYQLPPSREALRKLAAGAGEIIALVQPRQLGALRALASGGRVQSVKLPHAGLAARRKEEQVRDQFRGILADGAPARELLTLEPLLDEYDGIELAAAALALLERERTTRGDAPREAAAPETSQTARLFINAGTRDSVTARDLMGAITGETGISGDRIGRIEVRDTHSLVDVPAAQSEEVARGLTGTVLRGRRLQARVDPDRPPPPRGRPDSPASGARPRGRTDRGSRDRPEGRARREGGGPPEGRGRPSGQGRAEGRVRPEGRGGPEERGGSEGRSRPSPSARSGSADRPPGRGRPDRPQRD